MDKLLINHRLDHIRSYGLIVVFFFILITVSLLSLSVFASTAEYEDKKNRVITIYDGSKEKTIISSAANVREALRDAEVIVSSYDLVEPNLEAALKDDTIIINIHRARPVVVVDGYRQVRVITASYSMADIARVAEIKLYPEDRSFMSPVDDVLLSRGAGLQMNITRAKLVRLKLYGQNLEVRTQSVSVGDFLKEKKISLGVDDGMDHQSTDKIVDGMSLQVWRNGIQTTTVIESINFTTKIIKDATRNVGYREVQTKGQNGEKTVIYQIEMRDGQEVSRTKISEVVNSSAIEQVEIVGTKVDLPPGSHEDWMQIAGISSSDYGYVNYIIGRESGWSPTKYNYAGSGAYGLCQSLPASKMATFGSDYMTNPITQLKWCNSYAIGRYGSWAGAYNAWVTKHWW